MAAGRRHWESVNGDLLPERCITTRWRITGDGIMAGPPVVGRPSSGSSHLLPPRCCLDGKTSTVTASPRSSTTPLTDADLVRDCVTLHRAQLLLDIKCPPKHGR